MMAARIFNVLNVKIVSLFFSRHCIAVVIILTLIALQFPKNSYSVPVVPETFADVAEKALPAVVNISTTAVVKKQNAVHPFMRLEEFFNHSFPFFDNDYSQHQEPEERKEEFSRGTGFIIDEGGFIVTNYHVIDGSDQVFVHFNDNNSEEIEAQIVGFDRRTDIALLKIDYHKKLPALKLGNPDYSKVGDWVVAIGNPFGLGGTVTSGIISAKARSMQIGYNDLIQTDASINMGNSGGPMLNMDAEVIGVNRIILSRTGTNIGIGFAVSAKTVKYVIDSIKKRGKVIRPWFGFYFQPMNEKIAENLGLKDDRGVIVSRVLPRSPAEDSGMTSGDVLTHIDGIAIDKSNLFSVMLGRDVEKKAEITVLRDGKEILLEAIPQEEPQIEELHMGSKHHSKDKHPDGPVFEEEHQYGLKVKELLSHHRSRFEMDEDIKGVLVESVRRGSAAYFAGLRPGMVIMSVNKKETPTVEEFRKVCAESQKDDKNSTLLLVHAGGVAQFIVMRER